MLIAGLCVALAAVGGGYALHRTLYATMPAVDLTPAVAPPAPVAAPVARAVRADQPASSAVPQIDSGWLRRTGAAAGIPEPALRAYARAELMAPGGCRIGWTTLAGIGWVESHHATIGGRTLGADGYASERILGPALNGVGDVAAIPATASSTRYHGDPVWDHAVGPMQFIPSTWDTWGSDGDGDGVADPNDLDDAALAAARYLCAGDRDLTTGVGWTAAVLSYNHSAAYLDDVHAAATAYAERTA